MGDGYSGIDGSLWYRNLKVKIDIFVDSAYEILKDEPQLKDNLHKYIDIISKELYGEKEKN